MTEGALIQVSLSNVVSKQKIKMNPPWHLIPFKSQVYAKHGTVSIISPCFSKGRFFSDKPNLSNLVDIQS